MNKKSIAKALIPISIILSIVSILGESISNKKTHKLLITMLSAIILMLSTYAIWFTIPYLSGKESLFDVKAHTGKLEIFPFKNINYQTWNIENAIIYENCTENNYYFTGSVLISHNSNIEFRINSNKNLEITITNDIQDNVAKLDNNKEIRHVSECLIVGINDDKEYVFPIDGIVVVGDEITSDTMNTRLLKKGSVTIGDKRIFSDEYYQNEPITLSMGDKFLVKKPRSQASGFVNFNKEQSLYVSFRVKGESGQIQRYKSETIVIKNSVWDKLLNDDLLTLLWLTILFFTGLLRTALLMR